MKYIICLLFIFNCSQIHAQLWTQNQKIVASDRSANDFFGESVAIDGDRAIIGTAATSGNINQNFVGSAYIFEKNGSGVWNETQILYASDAKPNDNFGNAVVLNGNFAFVGAIFEGFSNSNFKGAVYVYERNAAGFWNEIQKITPSDREVYQRFGNALALHGDTLIVGAFDTNFGDGAVLIYEKDVSGVWNETQILEPSDLQNDDEFGRSIAIDGDTILIGAEKEDNQLSDNSGAAYIFTKNDMGIWEEQQKLTSSIRQATAWFGSSVTIDGDYAVVGAYHESDFDNNQFEHGAAYVFKKNANDIWVEHQRLIASDGINNDRFGTRVIINDNRIYISAYNKTVFIDNVVNYNRAGAVYLFSKNDSETWNEEETIAPTPRYDLAGFGYSLAIDQNQMLVGAWTDRRDENNLNVLQNTGSCYFFETNTLSVNENKLIKTVLYPNPSTDFIYLSNVDSNEKYKVYDLLGSLIMKGDFIEKIDVQNLTSGVYFLEIKNNVILKFIKN